MVESRTHAAVECLECGAALFYCGTGRRPRYCGQTCRSRAFETRRPARAGKVSTELVERVVEVETPLDAQAVVQWLQGHPRRLSAVMRAMEWTPAQQDGLRLGLESAQTDQVLVSRQEYERLTQARSTDPMQRFELAQLQMKVQSLTRTNEELAHRLQGASDPGVAGSHLPRSGAQSTASDVGCKTVSMNGKDFRVPAVWTRQQVRRWVRDNPDQGRPQGQ